jgi:hypothetical protein
MIMASIPFLTADAVTNAMAALAASDQMRCFAHSLPDGSYVVDAPDELEAALRADHSIAPQPIPDVSSAQAKITLHRAGKLDVVKAAVEAAGVEVQIWFAEARTWQRANPHVEAVRAALGMSKAEGDDLFRQAAQIQA